MSEVHARAQRPVADLVHAARAGDREALGELVAGELPRVYNVIGRALAGHADVDDVVQETLIQIVRGLPGLREPDRFRVWVLAIANRQVQLYLRTRRRNDRRRQELTPELPDPEDDFADRAVDGIVLAGQRGELAEAARWLQDDDRVLLSLWWQEMLGELTRAEVAAALGVTVGHAGVRVKRMRDQLDAARLVVRALHLRDCEELTHLVRGWDGVADSVWRKRLVRHTRDCPRCAPRREDLVPAGRLMLGLQPLPLPLAVAAAGQAIAAGYQPAAATLGGKAVALVAAALLAGGGAVIVALEDPPSTGPAVGAASQPPPEAPTAPRTAPATGAAGATPGASPAGRPVTGVTRADIFVAPDGSDAADGSLERPYATIAKAVAVVRPGQTIALRGGVHRPATALEIGTSGDAAHRITLSSYRDERPVLDGSAVPADEWLVTQKASYWTVQGLEIRNAARAGYVCLSCKQSVFRWLTVHGNGRVGLMLRGDGTADNQVLDSDFFANRGGDGVGLGLGVKFGGGAGNVVRGVRAYGNGESGIDVGEFAGAVAVEHSWSWGNAGNGFTLGGGAPATAAAHVLHDNAAWDNAGDGFSDDGNAGGIRLTGNTAWRNGDAGFTCTAGAAVLQRNVAVANRRTQAVRRADGTSWDAEAVTTSATFRSTDAATAQGARQPDGRLPVTDFLGGAAGSGAAMRAP
ncbi:sigma-70 family RNA polymerase sigma factor [Dactylosporangium siamense]|uniref:Sigma-70 family RNA polymerase sigma factor n=1 Tax=Dactylosporangium siamense TaxID=685454 RepID=A0A919U9S7_9ACTN|nr:sigma-70 family RNA polymerase sigma factor [Dactylosporangium siamense]GIG47232.1 hypothetical protein Dsi01nite_052730 [Dactylosporangium siamense]